MTFKMANKNVLFVSTGRTGTKTLASFFSHYFDNSVGNHQPPHSRFFNMFSNMYVSGIFTYSFLDRLVYKYKIPQIISSSKDYYVEANTMNYIISKNIQNHFSETFIIHIIRDPRDYVTSYMNWVHGRAFSTIANRVIPFWHPNGYLTGQFSLVGWMRLSEFERMCWFWRFENQLILDLNENNPRFMSIRFEDLFELDTSNCLKKVLSFIGLEYDECMLDHFRYKQNVSRKDFFDNWNQWSSEESRNLHYYCSRLMKVYGYGLESEWINRLS